MCGGDRHANQLHVHKSSDLLRSCHRRGNFVIKTQLSFEIAAPREQTELFRIRERGVTAGGDIAHAVENGDCCREERCILVTAHLPAQLALEVHAPREHSTAACECNAVAGPTGDFHDRFLNVRDMGWDRAVVARTMPELAIATPAPSETAAVSINSYAVLAAT